MILQQSNKLKEGPPSPFCVFFFFWGYKMKPAMSIYIYEINFKILLV